MTPLQSSNLYRAFTRISTFAPPKKIEETRLSSFSQLAQMRAFPTSQKTYTRQGPTETASRVFSTRIPTTRADQNEQNQALINAIHSSNLPKVRLALQNGANPALFVNECQTILHLAAAKGDIEIVRALLAAKVNPNQRNHTNSVTALHTAAFHGHGQIVDLLVKNGAHVNIRSTTCGRFPIDEGIEHFDCVKNLLEAGSTVNHVSGRITTPLIEACKAGQEDTVKLLLDAEANPDMRCGPHTPIACALRFPKVLKLLLEKNAIIDHRAIPLHHNQVENSLLHIAAATGYYDSVELLLAAGATPKVTNKDGLTPLELAQQEKAELQSHAFGYPAIQSQIENIDICISKLEAAMETQARNASQFCSNS